MARAPQFDARYLAEQQAQLLAVITNLSRQMELLRSDFLLHDHGATYTAAMHRYNAVSIVSTGGSPGLLSWNATQLPGPYTDQQPLTAVWTCTSVTANSSISTCAQGHFEYV